jgi:hypothetical protein
VTDWESDDWPLKEWLEDAAKPIPVQLITVKGQSSRGKGLNIAAKNARANNLLVQDTDMLFSPVVINNGIKILREGKKEIYVLLRIKTEYEPKQILGRKG